MSDEERERTGEPVTDEVILNGLLADLRSRVGEDHDDDGMVAWPADLTEDERVAYMEILHKENILTGLGMIISINPEGVRAAIRAGTTDI